MRVRALTERRVAAAQAVFYVSTGLWPVLHRESFERVTGRKRDFWLAQTVGVTVAAVGAGLGRARLEGQSVSPQLKTVAGLTAAGLALIDIVYVLRARISRIYLLDAAAEGALIAAWLASRDSRD